MTALLNRDHLITPEEYLEGEETATQKHEFLNGMVYAMAGGTALHNGIVLNILVALRTRLRGGPCRVYGSDMKLRIQSDDDVRFYYPDGQVVCGSPMDQRTFQDHPVLTFEVISESTRRACEDEKRLVYLSVSSLKAYLVVETSAPKVALVSGKTERVVFSGLDAVIPLPFLGIEVPLSEVYEGVDFSAGMAEAPETA